MTDAATFEHDALLYDGLEEFLGGTCAFIEEGLEAREPVMVAVPGNTHPALRDALNRSADRVRLVDMTELGRNPGRIIPEVREWVHRQDDRRCRFIGEPIWPGRRPEETVEATRHEALINLAFANANAHILCPYDQARLDPEVVIDAHRTHPYVLCGHERWSSDSYSDPVELWRSSEWSLPEPVEPVPTLDITKDLGQLRRFTSSRAAAAGVPGSRLDDLVLAVDEAATNALVHGRPPAALRIWVHADQLVCEIADGGQLQDPLAGRRCPAPDWPSGRGLWLINQLCDLVELRPRRDGTTIRMHVDL